MKLKEVPFIMERTIFYIFLLLMLLVFFYIGCKQLFIKDSSLYPASVNFASQTAVLRPGEYHIWNVDASDAGHPLLLVSSADGGVVIAVKVPQSIDSKAIDTTKHWLSVHGDGSWEMDAHNGHPGNKEKEK
jgi:hypothetical protein